MESFQNLGNILIVRLELIELCYQVIYLINYYYFQYVLHYTTASHLRVTT